MAPECEIHIIDRSTGETKRVIGLTASISSAIEGARLLDLKKNESWRVIITESDDNTSSIKPVD